MSSGDTVRSGSSKRPAASTTAKKTNTNNSDPPPGPKPFIPKRPPPAKSVYTEQDYDSNGNLKQLRQVPMGEQYEARRGKTLFSNDPQQQQQPSRPPPGLGSIQTQQPQRELTDDEKKLQAREDRGKDLATMATHPITGAPGKGDVLPTAPTRHKVGMNKYDLRTPPGMCDHDEQYIAVIRTIENHHPDEDRILQKFALQYAARKAGTYDSFADPPVVLSDLLPTVLVVIDRVFSKDEAMSEQKPVGKYVQQLAKKHTDLDVVPVYMGKPVKIPLDPSTQWVYKDKIIGQIMEEFYENQSESVSDILDRVEADRRGEEAGKPKWHVYDGVSEQGPFGPQLSNTKTIAEERAPGQKQLWGERQDEEDDDDDADDNDDDDGATGENDEGEGEWTTVATPAKSKRTPKPVEKRGGKRGPVRK